MLINFSVYNIPCKKKKNYLPSYLESLTSEDSLLHERFFVLELVLELELSVGLRRRSLRSLLLPLFRGDGDLERCLLEYQDMPRLIEPKNRKMRKQWMVFIIYQVIRKLN